MYFVRRIDQFLSLSCFGFFSLDLNGETCNFLPSRISINSLREEKVNNSENISENIIGMNK